MKRSHPTENIFSKIPLELTYEIQSKLPVASLIQFGRTCLYLNQTQKDYIEIKEKDLSDLCLKRIIEDLEQKDLLNLLRELLPLFKCVIKGLYLSYYLTYDTEHTSNCIVIEMPKFTHFFSALRYIHKKIDRTRYMAYINLEHKIHICPKGDPETYLVRIIYSEYENVYQLGTCSSILGVEYSQYTDLKKVYFKNVSHFLASKEMFNG